MCIRDRASAPLAWTADVSKLASCDHMLVQLDDRTWTSGAQTAKLVEEIHAAMRIGVHLLCVHEFPAVVGPPRHECEFGLMFDDDWTPAHLTSGPTNLYKEIALALKGAEWRQPGLVAFASKVAASAGEHSPIAVVVPASYIPATDEVKVAEVALEESHVLPRSTAAAASTADRLISERPYVDLATGTAAAPVSESLVPDLSDRLKGMFSGERLPEPNLNA